MGQSDGQQADASGGVASQLHVDTHGAFTEKYQGEGADKLRSQFLGEVVHPASRRVLILKCDARILSGFERWCQVRKDTQCSRIRVAEQSRSNKAGSEYQSQGIGKPPQLSACRYRRIHQREPAMRVRLFAAG